jgi:hypothetical protein
MKKQIENYRGKRKDEVYLGFGIFARKKQLDKLLSLRVLKPQHEGGDYELLLDTKTFLRLKKFAKKYWK